MDLTSVLRFLALPALLLLPWGPAPAAPIVVSAAISLTDAYRVLRLRTPRQDHYTYMLFTYWYCLTLLSAVFVL